jgi:ribosome production factor 2
MVEFGVDAFVALSEMAGPVAVTGAKPCIVFRGSEFESEPDFIGIKSVLLDFFRVGATAEESLLYRPGIRHVIVIFAAPGRKVMIRAHVVDVEQSSTNPLLPRVELIPMGPSMDLTLRRAKWAAPDMVRASLKQPKINVEKKQKNVDKESVLGVMGRLHVGRQDLESLQTRKGRATRKPKEIATLGK